MNNPEYLLQHIEEKILALNFPPQPANLYEPITYALSNGGKRIRPLLTLTSCSIFDHDPADAVNVAMAIEVFHNFTLLHDDILDNAPIRRGKPSVFKKWNQNIAILSGDAMLITAYSIISAYKGHQLQKLLTLFNKTAIEICEGQQYDMDFETAETVTEAEYLEMIRLKTSVLLGCCLKSGAIVANAPENDAEQLYFFGIALGMAFQLQDDLLDTFGDENTFGKKIGGDILAAKKTILLIQAIESLSGSDRDTLTACFGNPQLQPDEKIRLVKALYQKSGCEEKTKQKIQGYYQTALNHLTQVNLPDGNKKPLADIAAKLMKRVS